MDVVILLWNACILMSTYLQFTSSDKLFICSFCFFNHLSWPGLLWIQSLPQEHLGWAQNFRAPCTHTHSHLGAVRHNNYRHVFSRWEVTREPRKKHVVTRRTWKDSNLRSGLNRRPWTCATSGKLCVRKNISCHAIFIEQMQLQNERFSYLIQWWVLWWKVFSIQREEGWKLCIMNVCFDAVLLYMWDAMDCCKVRKCVKVHSITTSPLNVQICINPTKWRLWQGEDSIDRWERTTTATKLEMSNIAENEVIKEKGEVLTANAAGCLKYR